MNEQNGRTDRNGLLEIVRDTAEIFVTLFERPIHRLSTATDCQAE